jgi:hypothetical protein
MVELYLHSPGQPYLFYLTEHSFLLSHQNAEHKITIFIYSLCRRAV